MTLSNERCVACRDDATPVTHEELDQLLSQVSGWRLEEKSGVVRLTRTYRFSSFAPALDFSLTIGQLAEEEGHHPRLITEWGRVTVLWWTHKIGGLHRNDFVMAAKTDELFRQVYVGTNQAMNR